jgi:hypothetical protein
MKGYEDGPVLVPLVVRAVAQAQWTAEAAKCPTRPLRDARGLARDILRKEVIQPQVPLRLPCYDFTPVTEPTVAGCLPLRGWRTVFG